MRSFLQLFHKNRNSHNQISVWRSLTILNIKYINKRANHYEIGLKLCVVVQLLRNAMQHGV